MAFKLIKDGHGTCAKEITELTGMTAYDTPAGIMVVDNGDPMQEVAAALTVLEQALNPRRCTCPRFVITHLPGCPEWLSMT